MSRKRAEVIAELTKERKPIHIKCIGEGFSEDEMKFLAKRPVCSKLENASGLDDDGNTVNVCLCKVYVDPSVFWNRGGCPMADHYRPDLFVVTKEVKRVGQQKQKKRK